MPGWAEGRRALAGPQPPSAALELHGGWRDLTGGDCGLADTPGGEERCNVVAKPDLSQILLTVTRPR